MTLRRLQKVLIGYFLKVNQCEVHKFAAALEKCRKSYKKEIYYNALQEFVESNSLDRMDVLKLVKQFSDCSLEYMN